VDTDVECAKHYRLETFPTDKKLYLELARCHAHLCYMRFKLVFSNAIAIALFLISTNVFAQPGIISTVAGTGIPGFSGDGGAATLAKLNHPGQIAVDGAGNIYVAELNNNIIRKINTSGIISTIAGTGIAGFSGDGGPATAAKLNSPYSIAIDVAGNMYIGDFNNQRVRKINTSGIITTIAGNGTGGYGGDGGPATSAMLWNPGFLNVDGAGNVYVSDNQNQRIRKINIITGIITTVAGNGTVGYSGDGGLATSARLCYPNGVFVDNPGNIYIGDAANNVIRKVNTSGIISTIAGTGVGGFSGDGGPATAAKLNIPQCIYVDDLGNILFTDSDNDRVRKISTSGIITTIAGTGVAGYSGDGGLATAAQLNGPDGVVVDPAGKIYIAEAFNNRIRMIGAIATNHAPSFSTGATAVLNICSSGSLVSINSLLAVTDLDAGQTLTWSTLTAPAHGTLVAAYSSVSTGGTVTPAGLSFTPVLGYSGVDMFKVIISDGAATDTMTVNVTINTPPGAGAITGIDTICPGTTVTLSASATGGMWSHTAPAVSAMVVSVVTGLTPGLDTIIYTVSNDCGIASTTFLLTVKDSTYCTSGVDQLAAPETISIFPNPSSGTLHLFVPSTSQQSAQLVVTNMLGQRVTERTIRTNGDLTVDLDVAPGIYVLDILTDRERYTGKVTITR
jgi:sugar lactone lactonase YvrE